MKKQAKLMVIVLAVVMALSVVVMASCAKEETKVAYGLVHGKGYVGKGTAVRLGDSLVSADLDEACLPTYVKADGAIEGYTVEGKYLDHGSEATSHFYKTVKFADVTMIYDATEVNGVSKGYMVGTQTMVEFFAVEANCEKYFEAVAKNEVKVVLADGEKTDIMNAKALLKTQNGYWSSPSDKALGWKANVEATCSYLVEYGFDGLSGNSSDLTRKDNGGKLDNEIIDKNNVATGATWTDMMDYVNLIKAAFEK